MAEQLRILGQLSFDTPSWKSLYYPESGIYASCSTLILTNRLSNSINFSVAADGDGLGAPTLTSGLEKYIYYDITLPPQDSFAATIGMTLNWNYSEGLLVSGENGLSCTLFGAEVYPEVE